MRNKTGFLAALLLWAVPAQAHVALTENVAAPGAHHVAHFRVGHGCDGSPTIAVAIEIPAAVRDAVAQKAAGWTLTTGKAANGNRMVTWKGGPAAADQKPEFAIAMTLPNKAMALAFPALQTCVKGQADWTEIAAPGVKAQHPAPMLTVRNDAPASARGYRVRDAWVRLLPGKLPAAGYFTLANDTQKPAILSGAASPDCGMLMLHKSEHTGGMTGMDHVPEVDVPAGGAVTFAPGGLHLMCEDPKAGLKPGGRMKITLSFRDGSTLDADFALRNAAGK